MANPAPRFAACSLCNALDQQRQMTSFAEVAEKIEDVIQEDMSDRVRTLRIKDLMTLRLYQCLQCALA
jgi:hypothetical protein